MRVPRGLITKMAGEGGGNGVRVRRTLLPPQHLCEVDTSVQQVIHLPVAMPYRQQWLVSRHAQFSSRHHACDLFGSLTAVCSDSAFVKHGTYLVHSFQDLARS